LSENTPGMEKGTREKGKLRDTAKGKGKKEKKKLERRKGKKITRLREETTRSAGRARVHLEIPQEADVNFVV